MSTLRDTKVPISERYCYFAPGFPCLQCLLPQAFPAYSFWSFVQRWERRGDKASSYLHKHSRLAAASGKGAAVRGLQGPPPCREACPSTAAEEHSRLRSRPQSPWQLCLQTWGVAFFNHPPAQQQLMNKYWCASLKSQTQLPSTMWGCWWTGQAYSCMWS